MSKNIKREKMGAIMKCIYEEVSSTWIDKIITVPSII